MSSQTVSRTGESLNRRSSRYGTFLDSPLTEPVNISYRSKLVVHVMIRRKHAPGIYQVFRNTVFTRQFLHVSGLVHSPHDDDTLLYPLFKSISNFVILTNLFCSLPFIGLCLPLPLFYTENCFRANGKACDFYC